MNTKLKVYFDNEVPKNAKLPYLTYSLDFSNKSYQQKVYVLNILINDVESKSDSDVNTDLINYASNFEVRKNYDDLSNNGFLKTTFGDDDLNIHIRELSGSQLLKREINKERINTYQLAFIININDNRG